MIIGWFTIIVFLLGFIVGVSLTNALRSAPQILMQRQSVEELAPCIIPKETPCPSTVVPVGSSKGEIICRRALEAKFPGHSFAKARPDILRNPATGRNLEYDCYNKELGLAVEYNGRQHYQFTKKFHASKEDFEKQQARDKLKIELSKKANVHLIIIPYTVPHDEIAQTIYNNLPKELND